MNNYEIFKKWDWCYIKFDGRKKDFPRNDKGGICRRQRQTCTTGGTWAGDCNGYIFARVLLRKCRAVNAAESENTPM